MWQRHGAFGNLVHLSVSGDGVLSVLKLNFARFAQSLFGYEPRIYYRGRGAFESMGAGLDMQPGDIAFKVTPSFNASRSAVCSCIPCVWLLITTLRSQTSPPLIPQAMWYSVVGQIEIFTTGALRCATS